MEKTKSRTKRESNAHELVTLTSIWKKVKSRRSLNLFWRDRLSYRIFSSQNDPGKLPTGPELDFVLDELNSLDGKTDEWCNESNSQMLEATPLQPYTPQLDDMLSIEEFLVQRRQLLESCLHVDQVVMTMSSHFPQPGIPVRQQSHSNSESVTNAKSQIFSSHQGSSETTLKIDFNAHDLREARYLYDQLTVLTPIMVAMTPSSPIDRSQVRTVKTETHSVDERTARENNHPPKELRGPVASRFCPAFLSLDSPRSHKVMPPIDQATFKHLKNEGLDEPMALFLAQSSTKSQWSEFLRRFDTDQNRGRRSDNSVGPILFLGDHVQLMLPPLNNATIGFGVRFCGIEAQLTDFANAAYMFFAALLRFAILGFELDFRIEPDLAMENNEKAYRKDAVLNEKFWWRMPRWRVDNLHLECADQHITTDDQPSLVTLDQVVNGDPARPETIGLSGVVEAYLADIEDSSEAGSVVDDISTASHRSDMSQISEYLTFVRRRAKGTAWTDARWIHDFVTKHPKQSGEALTMSPEVFRDFISSVQNQNSYSVEKFTGHPRRSRGSVGETSDPGLCGKKPQLRDGDRFGRRFSTLSIS